jgi:hypothetical protein
MDKLVDMGVAGIIDLIDRADPNYTPFVNHCDAISNLAGTGQVMGD